MPRPDQTTTVRSPRPILVVDDDMDVRETVALILADQGFPTVAVASGAEALAALRQGLRPCIVFVDLMMPGMDGWQLVAAIRELGIEAVQVVSMTAGPYLDSAPVSADYLQKPFGADELLCVARRQSETSASLLMAGKRALAAQE